MSEKIIFLGYEDFVDNFWGHRKTVFGGHFYAFRSFLIVKVLNGKFFEGR